MDVAVIELRGEKIYAAGFELPVWSSRCPSEITIDDAGIDSIVISNRRKGDDFRKNNKIYEYFKSIGKLKE